jgi:polar amino acid transport system substrate-binding protein
MLSLFALWLGASLLVAAYANTLDDIKSRGKIIIGVKADYPPFGSVNAQGKNAGFGIDIAHYVALKLLGSEEAVKLVPVVASNRIQFLRQGRIDLMIATTSITKKRAKVINFSHPYYSSGTSVMARKDSGIQSWDDLKGKKVCGIQGSFYNTQLSKMGLHLVNFPGTAEVTNALKSHRCIGFAYDDASLAGFLRKPQFKNYTLVTKTILQTPWGMGIRKGDNALLKAVNNIILHMEASGYIYALQTKWGIPHSKAVVQQMQKARQKLGLGKIGSNVK